MVICVSEIALSLCKVLPLWGVMFLAAVLFDTYEMLFTNKLPCRDLHLIMVTTLQGDSARNERVIMMFTSPAADAVT